MLCLYFQNLSGDTALHSAAQYGHVAVVDVLLQVRNKVITHKNVPVVLPATSRMQDTYFSPFLQLSEIFFLSLLSQSRL